MAGEIVEIRFLQKDVGGRRVFLAGEAEEHDGRVELRDEAGAALGVDAVGFPLAGGSGRGERSTHRQERDCGTKKRANFRGEAGWTQASFSLTTFADRQNFREIL